jgi:superfamily II helicase
MTDINSSPATMAVICVSADQPGPVVPGSAIQNCARCDKRIWLSAETQQRIGGCEVELLCPDCAREYIAEGEVLFHGPNAAEIAAAEKVLNRIRMGDSNVAK